MNFVSVTRTSPFAEIRLLTSFLYFMAQRARRASNAGLPSKPILYQLSHAALTVLRHTLTEHAAPTELRRTLLGYGAYTELCAPC